MSKRNNGEGNIRQRPNGTWEARYSYQVDGELKRGSVYGPTKTATREKLNAVLDRVKDERAPVDSTQTLATWAAEWVQTTLEVSDRKETTKQTYGYITKSNIIDSAIGPVKMRDLKPSHLDKYFGALKTQGLSASTRRNIYAVLSAMLKGAIRDGLLDRNPLDKISRPKAEHVEAVFLEPHETKALLEQLDPANRAADPERAYEQERDYLLGKFLALTGLRRGEALGLDWFNANTAKGRINIRWTLSRVRGQLIRTEPKTTNSRRVLDLSPDAVRVLEQVRELQKRSRVEILPSAKVAREARGGAPLPRHEWKDENLVFTTREGKAVEPRNLLRSIAAAAKRAGITKTVGTHTLRHSAATAMLMGGQSIFTVSRYLGHESIDITVRYYGHIGETGLKDASNTLARMLSL